MTVTGKVQKYKLREQAIEELGLAEVETARLCGRYTLSTVDGPDLAQRFGLVAPPDEETLGRFNVCPTETIATVLQPNQAASVAWGLRPFRNQKFTPINVRSETVQQRFKWLMGGGRCLVLADGWYEWMKQESQGRPAAAVPLHGRRRGRRSRSPASTTGRASAILTTEANEICAPVHDRMPVVLPDREAEAAWLSEDVGVEEALELLVPLDSARVSVAPANPAVNKAGVEGAELLTPRRASHAAFRHAVLKGSLDGRRARGPRGRRTADRGHRRLAARGASAPARPGARPRARHGDRVRRPRVDQLRRQRRGLRRRPERGDHGARADPVRRRPLQRLGRDQARHRRIGPAGDGRHRPDRRASPRSPRRCCSAS